jgi:hypothetical protein
VFDYVLFDDKLIDHEYLGNRAHIYENFVKTEKQFAVSGEAPKTRCICSPSAYCKYICGPIVLELERNFKNHFFGYKVPANWEKMEDELMRLDNLGFKHTLQLDGSGFDLTQSFPLKQIVDWKVYERTKNYELHTDYKNFEKIYKRDRRIIKCMVRQKGKCKEYGSIEVSGKTFSGSPDTTLMNTIRMVMYNRYVNEHLTKLKPYIDYWLWVKGDDVVCFYKDDLEMRLAHSNYLKVFTSKGNIQPHGLGQIAKFYKIGNIEDIDFCSINVIKTLDNRYKVIRNIKSIATKENYSLKAAKYTQEELLEYHQSILTSVDKWVGGNNMLKQYYECIHNNQKVTRKSWLDQLSSLLKRKKKKPEERKIRLTSDKPDHQYLDRYLSYEEHLKIDERQTTTPLEDIDISIWAGARQNDEELQEAIKHIQYNLAKLYMNNKIDNHNNNLHKGDVN